MTEISIVICTHQRAADLARALQSLVGQEGIEQGVEVVVVDNRSTDETPEVVRRFTEVLPLRCVFEQTLGLCHARNRGWREAQGGVIAYLDDDAVALPGWLAAVSRAFGQAAQEVGCVGGRVIPDWEAPCPHWVSQQVSLGLTIVDWSEEARPILDLNREWLVGANFAFRIEALEAAGGFHPGLDRVGSRMLSSGDVFMLRELIRRGFACHYEPAMAVRHRVPAGRLTKGWFRSRYFWQGVSDAAMELIAEPHSKRRRLSSAATRGVGLLRTPGELAALLRSTDDAAEFEKQCWTLISLGKIAGLLGAAGR